MGSLDVNIRCNSALPEMCSSSATHVDAMELADIGEPFVTLWQDLADRSAEPNPFFEPWMLIPALRAFAKPDAVQLLAYYEGDMLCGLIPVFKSKLYYRRPIPHWSGWLHDNAFCGVPLVLAGSEKAFLAAVLDWAHARSKHDLFLHLSHIAESGPFFTKLREHCCDNGLIAAIVHREERAMLQSTQSPDDYFVASMSGKKRKELRRLTNRLSEEGTLAFCRQTDADALPEWTDQFLALEQAGWKGRDGSALSCDSSNASFFRQTLEGAAKVQKLERLTLSLDNRPIAMLVNFITPPGAYSFKTTFDENYARYSPGVLLQRENLDLLAHPKVKWTDSCAAADHPMIERIWREKRSMVRVNIGLGGTIRQALFRQMLRHENGAEILGAK